MYLSVKTADSAQPGLWGFSHDVGQDQCESQQTIEGVSSEGRFEMGEDRVLMRPPIGRAAAAQQPDLSSLTKR